MASYKSMYIDLFVAMKRASNILNKAGLNAEEMKNLTDEEIIELLSKNDKSNEEIRDEARVPIKIDKILIGKNIRNMRGKHSMTIEELSKELKISTAYLGLIERGERNVTLNKLCHLSNFFGVDMEHFLRPYKD